MSLQGLIDVEPLARGALVLDPLLQRFEALLELVLYFLCDEDFFLV